MRIDWEALWYGPRNLRYRALWVLLMPMSLVYWAVSRAWHWLWDQRWRRPVRIAGVRVISVGNLVTGGSGKTPVVILLAQRATAAGQRVAVLSRGYGRKSEGLLRVDAATLLPAVDVGDEPRLIARACPGVSVWIGKDRLESARRAAAEGATLIILDDGFQHRRLHRDVDVVVDAGRGSGWPLPCGPMRETSLRRPAIIWGRHGQPGDVSSDAAVQGIRLPDGTMAFPSSLAGRRVVALAGIARPRRFLATLHSIGALVVASHFFRDHHQFSVSELEAILREAADLNAVVVTTQKDGERLGSPTIQVVLGEELRTPLPPALRFDSGVSVTNIRSA